MILPMAHVADLCRRVGFYGDDLHTAIALAQGASRNNTDFEHAVYPGPVAIYKGLWGVDLCAHDYLTGMDLADPYTAAETALDMTREWSGFDWCPAYAAGSHVAHLERATTAASTMPGTRTDPPPIPLYDRRRTLGALAPSRALLHNALQDYATRRR